MNHFFIVRLGLKSDMDLEAAPPLLAGEVLVLSNECVRQVCLFDDVLPRSGVLAPVGRSGTLWITNFRTILCSHVSDGASLPLHDRSG